MSITHTGHIEWECPSNIALIKYWGKKTVQLPVNPSLSFTLSESISRMSVQYDYNPENEFSLDFFFGDKQNPTFSERFEKYIKSVTSEFLFLKHTKLSIYSENTFPHSAGIASSASAFGALTLGLCSIEQEITGDITNEEAFLKKASYLARLGSGSACRSVYGGFVVWGNVPGLPGSDDELAMPLDGRIHPVFREIKDSILVVSSGAKAVSSSAGHELMKSHPFASARISQADNNMRNILKALQNGDLNEFIDIIENEALTLHALMLTSFPGYFLFKPETLQIIEKIRQFRHNTSLPVGFTLDAGPNVHLIYPAFCEKDVHYFINENLIKHCENATVIHDRIGKGPVRKV